MTPALLLALSLTAPAEPKRVTWTVDGLTREALVCAPASAEPAPLVFAFHGHGGGMKGSADQYGFHKSWPEAVVVYPQGVNTPGAVSDPEGKKPGWQHLPGDHGDRDVKFFDAMLAGLKKDYKVDGKRVYATGQSNGGAFTYVLWKARWDVFAAVAPTSAPNRFGETLLPKPALLVAGKEDPTVKFEWQVRSIAALKQVNKCGDGRPWEKVATEYPSAVGAPLVTFVHPGGHKLPPESIGLVLTFFRGQVRPE